ncbi:uncharacterized protein FIESC28_06785 [Fusarium coffeatum]|uniref:Uncharacterized protein n=1 Tax=Fusarium coffeatum TaxID=231269 RepID=A0A366RKI4_9HYPO|nr:uncharacterized protein FIESC28_06785 [Fusarium coffeatum]RBR16870.1 hypothetical protein FIESC28_06785 [Fusarium coffeatum]
MVSDTKGKASHVTSNNFHQPSSSSRHHSRSNHQPSETLNARDHIRSVDEDPHFSSTQSSTGQRRSSNRHFRSYNIPLHAERFSRDNSPVRLPQYQLSFRGQGPIPLRPSSLRSIPEDLPFESQQEQTSAPNFSLDNEGPVVPDIYPQYNYGDPNQQDPMDYSARYQNGSNFPAGHAYAQPSFTQGTRPADDPEKVRLRAELAAYQAMEGKIKASEKQREREEQIRKETEAEFQRRMEHIQKSQEEARRDIEKVKKEAEEATWKRAQTAQREHEAKEAEKEREAKIMESEIRIKIEMERKAEEAEKRAREKLEHEMELRLHEKMKGKMDDFMELAKQRFLAMEGPSLHQRATEWRGNRDELDYEENQDQQVKQQARPPSLPHSPRESLTDSSCLPSQFHKTENTTSIADRSHSGRRPPSVPVAPSQSFFYDETRYHEGSLCSDQGPPFHPHAAPPPRHRTGYMPPGHNPWHPSVHDYARGHKPRPPNLVEELSLAFAEVLRNWNSNDRMAGSMMDERTPFDYPPFEGQTSENPRGFYYTDDRASAFERHREWVERGRRQDWAQHFDETGQSPDPGAQTFHRPFPSTNMAPQPQQSSNYTVVDGDIDSDSDQASTYATPPESQAGDVMIGEDTAGGHTVAAIAPAVGRQGAEPISRRLVALEGDGSRTYVVSSLEDSFRDRKVAGQLYAATAHMNRQGKPRENGFVPGVKHPPIERDISQYLITDDTEVESLD